MMCVLEDMILGCVVYRKCVEQFMREVVVRERDGQASNPRPSIYGRDGAKSGARWAQESKRAPHSLRNSPSLLRDSSWKRFFRKKMCKIVLDYREHRAASMRSWVAMHGHFQDEFLPLCRDARESRPPWDGDDKKSNTQVD